jgi:hypothetical protein
MGRQARHGDRNTEDSNESLRQNQSRRRREEELSPRRPKIGSATRGTLFLRWFTQCLSVAFIDLGLRFCYTFMENPS